VPPDEGAGFGLAGGADDEHLRDQIFEAIAPVLGELASEIRRSLDYYRSRGAQVSVDRVLLTGGTANLTNLAAFLQNELQAPVAVADPLAGLEVTSRHYDPNYLATLGPSLAIAIGLAARDAVFSANPVPRPPKAPRAPKAAAAANATNPPA
jgi:type IV pilus assembly protein PilM